MRVALLRPAPIRRGQDESRYMTGCASGVRGCGVGLVIDRLQQRPDPSGSLVRLIGMKTVSVVTAAFVVSALAAGCGSVRAPGQPVAAGSCPVPGHCRRVAHRDREPEACRRASALAHVTGAGATGGESAQAAGFADWPREGHSRSRLAH